jgi:hypothetical protein
MNYIVIILGVIIILLIYILVQYVMATSTELTAKANLNDDISAIAITNGPANTSYSYGLWIYVNSWDMSKPKTIFNRNNNIKLYLDQNSPTLKCDILMNDDTMKTVEVTDNFPLQKWVHVIVSVANQYVDCYIDGKLVRSGRAYLETDENITTPKQPPTVDTQMKLGGTSRFDAYVTKFKHWDDAISPEIAYSNYMEGNGEGLKNFLSNYGLDVLIKKDNVEQSKFTLF